jgi:prolyl-tRNA editing enzyme YbaK/EbsC (Cys-tRNA(Pro) deacylase)
VTALTSFGSLTLLPATDRPDLMADPVALLLAAHPELAAAIAVTEIDPALSDTAALVAACSVPAENSANCVVVAGRRDGQERIAACLVLATTRADINGLVKRLLDVRKASFLPMERAVAETGMEYGGITPIGLPPGWRVLIDARVAATEIALIGSGVRRSKLVLPGRVLAALPSAEVIEGLALRAVDQVSAAG